jgi:aminodeoxyfutalosine synthase
MGERVIQPQGIGRDLAPIAGKVEAGERLTFEDGVTLFRTRDLVTLGALANHVREKWNGNRAYFNVNRHLNPTNVCFVGCDLCAFARNREGEPGAWAYSIEELIGVARRGYTEATSEFHIVGGLHPRWPFETYLEILRALKREFPNVHLKAYTMVEIDFLAKLAKKPVPETVRLLRDAGLDSCPGGGAEIFAKRVRDIICAKKISGERWLEVARMVHREGIRSNATMLYGHVETLEERVDHLLRLRELQDETGGFVCFIPLAFHSENTPLDHLPATSGLTDLKVIAVSRLLLDNFPHVKAYWVMIGPKVAQLALSWGADDLDGTIVDERITHAAGAKTKVGLTRKELVDLIVEAGREPVERNTLYEPLEAVS